MVSLLLHFSWIWVGLVICDNDQGLQVFLDIRREMQKSGVCLALVNMFPENMQSFMAKAKIY